MIPPLELIVAMMPHAIQIGGANRDAIRSVKDAEASALFAVQLAARMAEEALRLSQPPEPAPDALHAAIADLLGPRLSTPAQRAAILRGLDAMQSRGLVGITPDATFRPPDTEDDALTIVPVADIIAVLEAHESQS